MSCTEGGICTHREFNSDYREDCFSFGARRSFCLINSSRRFPLRLSFTFKKAGTPSKAISSSKSRCARRKMQRHSNFKPPKTVLER